jgi:hypothetical protein
MRPVNVHSWSVLRTHVKTRPERRHVLVHRLRLALPGRLLIREGRYLSATLRSATPSRHPAWQHGLVVAGEHHGQHQCQVKYNT